MQESVLECCFTADSTRLLAAGGDQNLRLWEIESRRERHTLTGHTAKVRYHPKSAAGPDCSSLRGLANAPSRPNSGILVAVLQANTHAGLSPRRYCLMPFLLPKATHKVSRL